MQYEPLGRTGVVVSRLCLGCMNFGDPTGEEESIRIMQAAVVPLYDADFGPAKFR